MVIKPPTSSITYLQTHLPNAAIRWMIKINAPGKHRCVEYQIEQFPLAQHVRTYSSLLLVFSPLFFRTNGFLTSPTSFPSAPKTWPNPKLQPRTRTV